MKTLIVGYGEIGQALNKVLSPYYEVWAYDLNYIKPVKKGYNLSPLSDGTTVIDRELTDCEIMHVCIPYTENFIDEVKKYQEKYKPKYIIVHSSVKPGTCETLGAIHSPVRGKHPNLEEGIRIFPKFLGGPRASEVADYFRRAGLKVILDDWQQNTEAGKLFDTEYYKVCIEFTKRVKEACDKNGWNFHLVYTLFNQTYNEGYKKLDMEEVCRPVLQPIMTEIGGHCLVPNSKLIKSVENVETASLKSLS